MLDLSEARGKLDIIDKKLVELFQERQDVVKDVAAYKINTGKKVLDRERELQKLAAVSSFGRNAFEANAITDIFTLMIAVSRKYQYQMLQEKGVVEEIPFTAIPRIEKEGVKVVYQGVEGAYSHAAMCQYFGKDVNCYHVSSFENAMKDAAEGKADYAVLPIENSSAGQVGDVYDLLMKYDAAIVDEIYLPVRHCLLGLKGTDPSVITTVYSHPQGLMQCGRYLNNHPDWQQISQANTAMSAKKVVEKNDPSKAAIASRFAGELYGLEVLEENINDSDTNTTRFIVVAAKKEYQEEAGKISICFEIAHESGSLYNILSHIMYNELNMTKIESRPIADRPFEYRFYLDFEGNLGQTAVKNALFGIKEEASYMKILGNYPVRPKG